MPISNLAEKRKRALEAGLSREKILEYERSKGINEPWTDQSTTTPTFGQFGRERVIPNLPTIGATAGSLAGPVGAGAGAAIGRGGQEILNQVLGVLEPGVGPAIKGAREVLRRPGLIGEELKTSPERVLPFLKDVGVEAGAASTLDYVLGKGLGGLGRKVLGPTGTKIKGIFPSKILKQADEFLETLGPKFERAKKVTKDIKVDIDPVIKEIEKIRKQRLRRTTKEIDKKKINDAALEVINTIRSKGRRLNPGDAHELVKGFADEVFGEAGKELQKRGIAGVAKSTMLKTAGKKLSDAVKTAIEPFDPTIRQTFEQWQAAQNIIRGAEKPGTGALTGGVISGAGAQLGSLLANLGLPGAGTALGGGLGGLGLALLFGEAPFFNFLARQALGRPLAAAGSAPSRAINQYLLQSLIKSEQDRRRKGE